MRNPLPLLREYPRAAVRAISAARHTKDLRLITDAVRLRCSALLSRLGVSTTSSVFGQRIVCSDINALVFAHYDVVLSGHYAVSLDTPAPYIIDCGANIGLSVLYFAHQFPGATITAFEPAPEAFAALRQNTAGWERVHTIRAAIGADDGTMDLWTQNDSMHAGVYRRRGVHTAVSVPVLKLSAFVTRDVDLLKLDIEGAESEVLRELSDAGVLRFVKAMIVEYHHHLGPQCLSEFLAMLEDAHFSYQIATGESSPIMPPGTFQDVHIYATRGGGI